LELALAAALAGSPGLDPGDVQALYLRAPDARANFAVLVPRASPGADSAPSRPAGSLGAGGSGTPPSGDFRAVPLAGPSGLRAGEAGR